MRKFIVFLSLASFFAVSAFAECIKSEKASNSESPEMSVNAVQSWDNDDGTVKSSSWQKTYSVYRIWSMSITNYSSSSLTIECSDSFNTSSGSNKKTITIPSGGSANLNAKYDGNCSPTFWITSGGSVNFYYYITYQK